VDIVRGEQVEAEHNGYIARADKRRRETEGERAREELWRESVRRFNARQQQELAWEWLRYHVARQRAHRKTFALLDAHHEAEIQRYERMLGLDGPEPNGHKESA
jgi:hypothetical protein